MPGAGTSYGRLAENIRQYAFRCYADDGGSINAGTALGAENAAVNVGVGVGFRVRVGVWSQAASAYRFALQYQVDGGGWAWVEASTGTVRIAGSAQFADGASTTARLSAYGGEAGFVAGIGIETFRNSNAAAINNQHTEHEWSLASFGLVAGQTVEFRLLAQDAAWSGGTEPNTYELFAYDQTPSVSFVSVGAAAGFRVSPLFQTALKGQWTGAYLIELVDSVGSVAVAGVGGQAFGLAQDGGAGGGFSPASSVTVPQGATSVEFLYRHSSAGAYTITVSATGSPYSINSAMVLAGIWGGAVVAEGVINPANIIFAKAYLFGTLANGVPDDVPWGELQKISVKISKPLKKAMGTSSLGAVAVGVSEASVAFDAEWLKVRVRQLQQVLGGTSTLMAAVANPTVAPTLAAAAGPTAMTAGFVAVRYRWRNAYGETGFGPVQTVSITNTQKITVTAVTLIANVTSIDWFVSAASFATAPLAAAAPVYYHSNNNGASFDITAYALATGPSEDPAVVSANPLGIARTRLSLGVNDKPAASTMRLRTPLDGSELEIILFGVVIPEIEIPLDLRDFAMPKVSGEAYGNGTDFGHLIVPGDQTAL